MIKKLNIIYTCDNVFLPLTSISMASVIKNNPHCEICFYIATESEKDDNFIKLIDFYKNNENIKIKYVNAKRYDALLESKNLDKWGSNSYYVYWKLYACEDLDLDYAWYLDSDVICVSEITNPELEPNKCVGAVVDCAHADYNKVAHIDPSYYFYNTGALFIDVNKYKENKCITKINDYIKNMKYKPLMCDQDILAISLQNEIQKIDPKYCYFAGYDYYGVHNSFEMYSLNKKPFYKEQEIEGAKDNTIFYHCLGGVFGRPWQENNFSPIKDEFEKYIKISAWPNYKTSFEPSMLFKIEKFLEFLPKPIYNKIHNLSQRLYIRSLVK
ncbi:MAG: hypothetical protein KBT35_08725 [Firmicutes bacterium]|nr:hypothetical protein [Candidatus Colivicinus equi]